MFTLSPQFTVIKPGLYLPVRYNVELTGHCQSSQSHQIVPRLAILIDHTKYFGHNKIKTKSNSSPINLRSPSPPLSLLVTYCIVSGNGQLTYILTKLSLIIAFFHAVASLLLLSSQLFLHCLAPVLSLSNMQILKSELICVFYIPVVAFVFSLQRLVFIKLFDVSKITFLSHYLVNNSINLHHIDKIGPSI